MGKYSHQRWFQLSWQSQERFLLSPYVTVFYHGQEITFERKDIDRKLSVQIIGTTPDYFLSCLSGICRKEELFEILSQIGEVNPENWIKACVQGGILEIW